MHESLITWLLVQAMAGLGAESDIASFYAGRSVFITGATGFMGKVREYTLRYSVSFYMRYFPLCISFFAHHFAWCAVLPREVPPLLPQDQDHLRACAQSRRAFTKGTSDCSLAK